MAATAFNLVCFVEQVAPPRDSGNFTMIFRIDLAEQRYCQGPCEDVRSIVATSASELVLEDSHKDRETWLEKVNLETGAYTLTAKSSEATRLRTGKCKRAEFTGFSRLRPRLNGS